MSETLSIPIEFLRHSDSVWTFFLLLTRFTGFFYTVPGIGGGVAGLQIRWPAALMLALASLNVSPTTPLPGDWGILAAELIGELMLGLVLGLLPQLVVTGVQVGAQVASGSMGLGVGELIDPTTGGSLSDLSRILGDLTIILFLLMGGHYAVIQALSGLSGEMPPGRFMVDDFAAKLLVDRTGDVFRVGVMISAPVIVALLLTQFVMGLITKAVPTVNIFIISFPLTIGIGCILFIVALPDIFVFVKNEFGKMERSVAIVADHVGESTPVPQGQ